MVMQSMKDTLPDGLFRHTDPLTSREAARRIAPHLTEIQADVLAAVKAAGTHGVTDYDLELHFNSRRSTYRTRRAELVVAGLICDSGERRHQDGSNRTVWVAV
jgi:hypothetical protein